MSARAEGMEREALIGRGRKVQLVLGSSRVESRKEQEDSPNSCQGSKNQKAFLVWREGQGEGEDTEPAETHDEDELGRKAKRGNNRSAKLFLSLSPGRVILLTLGE